MIKACIESTETDRFPVIVNNKPHKINSMHFTINIGDNRIALHKN